MTLLRKKKKFDEYIKSKILKDENLNKLNKQFKQLSEELNALKNELQPKTGSFYVSLFLGKMNVKQYRKEDRLKLKKEYHKFKERTDIFFLFAITLQTFVFLGNRVTELLFLSWLLYYYVTLALRENILKVNGSNIKGWWIHHHLIAVMVPLLMISWPKDDVYDKFMLYFHIICFYQGIVQILQNRYQKGRLYNLVALGKAGHMDVTGGEHTGSWLVDLRQWTPTFLIILPFLLILQISQIILGVQLIRFVVFEHGSFHAGLLGFIFTILGCGNLFTTIKIYFEKQKS